MEPKTDLDISRKLSTDGCLLDFGTFDKHGFIYVPSCIPEQHQSEPGAGDCAAAAATQASSRQESDSSEKIVPPGKGKVQMTPPIAKDPRESQASSMLQESGSSDKIVPTIGECNVQKTLIREDPGEPVGDVVVHKLKKRKLESVSLSLDELLMPPVTPDISRKLSTDGCLLDFGTFDKHGFIYVPSCIGEQSQSAPGAGDCAVAAATQAPSRQESDSSEKTAPPGKGKVQMTLIAKDPRESQASSLLQESGSSDKIVPTTGEDNVQKTLIREDPADSVGDVIVDKLKKQKLDADSPEVITGSFRRARLMNNLWYLAVINKMSNVVRRKERKTSG